jgi:hypothetical protein
MDKNSIYVKKSIENLREYAKLHGLKLVFRKTTTSAGDFCFFIYKPGCSSYIQGYDGYWYSPMSSNTSFEKCWEAAHKFISNYKG